MKISAKEKKEIVKMSNNELFSFWNICQFQRRLSSSIHKAEKEVSKELTKRKISHELNKRTTRI